MQYIGFYLLVAYVVISFMAITVVIAKWVFPSLRKKSINITTNVILIISLVTSFGLLITFNKMLDIHRVILKERTFPVANKQYEFAIDNLTSDDYRFILEFDLKKGRELWGYTDKPIDFEINSELRNSEKNLIAEKKIHEHSKISKQWDGILFYNLLTFKGSNKDGHRLTMTYRSDDNSFDLVKKKIYIEKVHDSAAMPYGRFVRNIVIVILIMSSLMLIISIRGRVSKLLTSSKPQKL